MERTSILDSTPESVKADGIPFEVGIGEILLGRLESIDDAGNAIVSLPDVPLFQKCIAISTIPVLPINIGRQIALMFTQAPTSQPIIMGFIYSPLQQVLDTVLANTQSNNTDADELVFSKPIIKEDNIDVQDRAESALYVDGRQLVLEGHEEVILRCGEASITLHKSGKISIRGKYLLSRATGVNRILGGSVQVN